LNASRDDEVYIAKIATMIDDVVSSKKIRDWSSNIDIKNSMMNEVEDVLYDASRLHGFSVSAEVVDAMIEKLILVAQRRDLV